MKQSAKSKQASDNQISFAQSLKAQIEKKGVVLDGFRTDLDMWHLSFLIDLLIQIKDNSYPYRHGHVEYDIEAFLKETEKIKTPKDAPDTVTCTWVLTDESTGAFTEHKINKRNWNTGFKRQMIL